MSWYLRSIRGEIVDIAYETRDLAIEQVSHLMHRERAVGRRAVNEDGQVSFCKNDGSLIDRVWIEDEEGNKTPIPTIMIDTPVEELAGDVRALDRFGAVYDGDFNRDELYDRDTDPKRHR